MIDIARLKIGDKVHYQPKHYLADRWENGMVKDIPDDTIGSVEVVYNCGGDWDNFKNYTSALTSLKDLRMGWKNEKRKQQTEEPVPDDCPYCPNQGWFVVPDHDGEPVQVQCSFCYTNKNSIFNLT